MAQTQEEQLAEELANMLTRRIFDEAILLADKMLDLVSKRVDRVDTISALMSEQILGEVQQLVSEKDPTSAEPSAEDLENMLKGL